LRCASVCFLPVKVIKAKGFQVYTEAALHEISVGPRGAHPRAVLVDVEFGPPRVSLCDQFGIQPNLFYRWQREFFDNGAAAFTTNGKRHQTVEAVKDRKIAALEEKLRVKNEVLAELLEEHVQLKKELGEP
jgi:transposase-like protein